MVDIKELFDLYLYNKRYIIELKNRLEMLAFSEVDGYDNIAQVLTGMPRGTGMSNKTADTAVQALEDREKADKARLIINRDLTQHRQDIKTVDDIIDSVEDIILFTILDSKVRREKTFRAISETDEFQKERLTENTITQRYVRYIDKINKEREQIEEEMQQVHNK